MPGPFASSDLRNYLAFGKQTSLGVGVLPTVFLPYIGSIDLDHGQGADEIREAGVGPYVSRLVKSKHDPKGGGGCAWRPQTMAKLAAWFLGADTSTLATGLYNHVASPAQPPVYVSVEQNLADESIERFVDGLLTSLSIEGDGNKDLMASIQWVACEPAASTAAVETYEAGISGVSAGGPYRQHEAVYTLDGTVVNDIKSYKLELAWKVDEDIRLSKVTREHLVKLELTGKITVTQLMLLTSDYRKINYGTTGGTVAIKNFAPGGAFDVTYSNGLSSTDERTARINCPSIDWSEAKYSPLNPDGETVWVERSGTVKKGTGNFVEITSRTADVAAYV